MPEENRSKTLAERAYHANVLPDGNLKSVDLIDVTLLKLQKEAGDEIQEEKEKGSP